MDYLDQSAADLVLALADEHVDWRQFTLIQQGELPGGPAKVRAAIIGESHLLAVTLRTGEVLHEVFACVRPETPKPPLLLGTLPRLPLTLDVTAHEGRVRYLCRPLIHGWVDGIDLAGRIRHGSVGGEGTLRLAYVFPSREPGRPAFTALAAWWEGRTLRAATAHCYPNEDRVATTETSITLAEEGEGDRP